MSDKDNGGPAFPHADDHFGGRVLVGSQGMTLRDYFAAKALPAAYAAWSDGYFGMNEDVGQAAREMACCAYQLADALLEARNK